jgi:hypothetical protein
VKLGIMQPYFFPYLGYFQLIRAVDCFVVYDDVNFIKGGWINRNFILGKGEPQRVTLQLFGASPNKLINAVEVGANRSKLIKTIAQLYGRAPYFDAVFPLIEECLSCSEKNLARYLEYLLRQVCAQLGIPTRIVVSSDVEKDTALKGADKVIAICKRLEADVYVNAIGGKKLYDRQRFHEQGLQLFFLQMGAIAYRQYGAPFTPNLSIIDVMMFNAPEQLSALLQDFTLV